MMKYGMLSLKMRKETRMSTLTPLFSTTLEVLGIVTKQENKTSESVFIPRLYQYVCRKF